MRRYQEAIREAANKELARRMGRVTRVPDCLPHQEIPSAARAAFPPVRTPSMYGWGTKGEVFCFKAGGLVSYESALERDFYLVMEWDYTVDSFAAQPYKVPYRLPSGNLGMYTPDCMVLSYNYYKGKSPKYEPTVYEIKAREELREQWPDSKLKLRQGYGFMRESGIRFKLLTEAQLHPVFVQNITFLLGFRGTRYMNRTSRDRRIVAAMMDVARPLQDGFTPRQILAAIEGLAPRAQLIPWLWNLYTDYVFQCDLLTPLTLDTVSWVCGAAGPTFANCGGPDDRADWRQDINDWRR